MPETTPDTSEIDVNQITFGCEFEVCIPDETPIRVGSYHDGIQVNSLPDGWNAQRDCSIQAPLNHQGVEVVSPILKGADGLRQIKAVCDWLNAIGAKVNRSTGFHVHVGWAASREALKRLTHNVSNFETALYASTGTHARENGNFCRGVRNDQAYCDRIRDGTATGLPTNRYHILNLTNIGYDRRNTVEFRVFAGTTNATKALGYIRLCLGLVEKSLRMKRSTKWVGKTPVDTSPLHRKGQGQTELTRLFYALGWTKGDQKTVFGNIQPDGLPSLDEAKAIMMKMGKKYDGNQEEEPENLPVSEPWRNWDLPTWDAWFCSLRRGQIVHFNDGRGTCCRAMFVRRYSRRILVQVSHLSQPVLVERGTLSPVGY